MIKSSKTNLDEALLILENETKRRIEHIQQLIEQSCETIRAKGVARLNEIPKSDRELTVAEFCEKYGSDAQRKFNTRDKLTQSIETSKKKPHNETQDPAIETQCKDTTNKRLLEPHDLKVDDSEREVSCNVGKKLTKDTAQNKRVKETHGMTERVNDGEAKSVKISLGHSINRGSLQTSPNYAPLFVHFEREDHTTVSICLDPDRTGKFRLDAPTDRLKEWNDTQRSAVRDQIQDLQDQLTLLKNNLL